MNSRTLLLAATALAFAPLARAEETTDVNDLTAKVLAILNSPAGQAEISKQLQALSAAMKANGQGDLQEAVTKLEAQMQAANANGDAAAGTATPTVAADAAQPAPAPAHAKSAPASGLQTSHLQGASIQSSGQGLTSPEEWQRMFSK